MNYRNIVFIGMVMFVGVACNNPSAFDTPVSNLTDRNKGVPENREGVTGIVKDRSGRLIEGASIYPKSLDTPSVPVPEIMILSDVQGHYYWPLKPGLYEFTVAAIGYQTMSQEIRVTAGRQATLNFVLR